MNGIAECTVKRHANINIGYRNGKYDGMQLSIIRT